MPRLSEQEIHQRLSALTSWQKAGDAIVRTFTFQDFVQALSFVNKVGELAEKADHHPDILINYRRVTLTLTTHNEKGLTERDFHLATQIDHLS